MKILFRNVTAVTMDPARPVLQNACVAVEGTRIASVGQEHPRGEFDRVIDGQGKALLPGLVNCHTHVPMALLRGYGGGHDLQHWLNDYTATYNHHHYHKLFNSHTSPSHNNT